MKNNWKTVDVLRYARHDWLNKIQLIKGNLALDRIDRVNEIVEEIIIGAQNESKLTNLQIPSTAEWVLTYNWTSSPLFLEFEVSADEANISACDATLVQWLREFTTELQKLVDKGYEQHLMLTFQLMGGDPRMAIDFTGGLIDAGPLREWCHEHTETPCFDFREASFTSEEVTGILEFRQD
ncbi:Spo0B C-terminal domain-containing protein [Bacillus marinisedimentorum]|uniref:Spo0B C-terminal domain-containing protein n=1 Tax=Bacillus marinisedimentorum TaxID=1821260 RepID=UPI000872E04F|nr:Spo0B C-terminal domain-containing protein [Bacillus marinisedimentorum]